MCKPVRCVAKISEALAVELGLTFKDNNNQFVVSMQLAEELEFGEFTIIPANYQVSDAKGILPINPKKPIVRPRP